MGHNNLRRLFAQARLSWTFIEFVFDLRAFMSWEFGKLLRLFNEINKVIIPEFPVSVQLRSLLTTPHYG